MRRITRIMYQLFLKLANDPKQFLRVLSTVPYICNAHHYLSNYKDSCVIKDKVADIDIDKDKDGNPLWNYFQNHNYGKGNFSINPVKGFNWQNNAPVPIQAFSKQFQKRKRVCFILAEKNFVESGQRGLE